MRILFFRNNIHNLIHSLYRIIFDEVITGFRIEYGGCQQYYDIKPDLVTYGKAAGGALPIGVVAGSKKVMNAFSGDEKTAFSEFHFLVLFFYK